MARTKPPNSLCDLEYFVLQVTPSTREVVLHLTAGETYSLGSYWRSETNKWAGPSKRAPDGERIRGALIYLREALGGDAQLAQDSLSTAFSFQWALVHVELARVVVIDALSLEERERGALKQLFGEDGYAEWIGGKDLNDVWVDKPSQRAASIS